MTAIRRRPETLAEGVLLAAVGGFLDAFTFIRFGVFANAQSGNVVLFGVFVARAEWSTALRHLAPVAVFLVGVATVESLGRPASRARLRRPFRVALGAEIVGLAVVAALPDSSPELVITLTVSFIAAIQFATFRTLVDTAYTSLLASGNLRTMSVELHRWIVERDELSGRRAARFGLVIVGFIVGAVVGAVSTNHLGNAAAAIPAGLLLVAFVAMVAETRRLEQAAEAASGNDGEAADPHPPS
jgi:uncharacterized membrane protein YoaK (UPF0700 family)